MRIELPPTICVSSKKLGTESPVTHRPSCRCCRALAGTSCESTKRIMFNFQLACHRTSNNRYYFDLIGSIHRCPFCWFIWDTPFIYQPTRDKRTAMVPSVIFIHLQVLLGFLSPPRQMLHYAFARSLVSIPGRRGSTSDK